MADNNIDKTADGIVNPNKKDIGTGIDDLDELLKV